jgi:hypothetical protein
VIDGVREVGQRFEPDELAFLSLTGKLELQFQEKLAWFLYGWAKTQGLVVTKEWSGVRHKLADIVILGEGELKGVLELKAMLTSDPLRRIMSAGRSLSDLKNDMARWGGFPTAEVIGILVAAHRKKVPPERWSNLKAVKYLRGDAKVFEDYKTEDAVLAACDLSVRESFEDFEIEQLKFAGGSAFDTEVDISSWVISSRKQVTVPP